MWFSSINRQSSSYVVPCMITEKRKHWNTLWIQLFEIFKKKHLLSLTSLRSSFYDKMSLIGHLGAYHGTWLFTVQLHKTVTLTCSTCFLIGVSNKSREWTRTTRECQAIMYLLVSNLFDFIMCTSGNHCCLAKCHEFPLTVISNSTTSCYFSPFFSINSN